MDPLSITASCVGLTSAIITISKAITQLASELNDAKSELSRTNSELTALQALLQQIGNRAQEASDSGASVTEELHAQIQSIVENCHAVVDEISGIITKCSARMRGIRSAHWVLVRGDVTRLRSSLESHKMSLTIGLLLFQK